MRPNGSLSTQIAAIAVDSPGTHDIKVLEAISKDLKMKLVNTYRRGRHGRQHRHGSRELLFHKINYLEQLDFTHERLSSYRVKMAG